LLRRKALVLAQQRAKNKDCNEQVGVRLRPWHARQRRP